MKYPNPAGFVAAQSNLEPLRKQLPYRIQQMKKLYEETNHELEQRRAQRSSNNPNLRKSLRAKLSALDAVIELAETVYENTGVDGNDQLRCEILDIVGWFCTTVCTADMDQYVPFCNRYRMATSATGLFCQARTVDQYHKNLVISGVAAVTYIGILALPIYAPLGVPNTLAWISNEYRKIHIEFRSIPPTPQTEGAYFRKLRKVRDDLREVDMPHTTSDLSTVDVNEPVTRMYEYSPATNASLPLSPPLPTSNLVFAPDENERSLDYVQPPLPRPSFAELPRGHRGSAIVSSPRMERLKAREMELQSIKRQSMHVV